MIIIGGVDGSKKDRHETKQKIFKCINCESVPGATFIARFHQRLWFG